MDIPAGFKRWRFHWFECPACRHRDWRTFARVGMTRQPVGIVYRFWCERCGAFAALARPMLPSLLAALIFLLITPAELAPEVVLDAAAACEHLNIPCKIVPDVLELRRGEIVVDDFLGLPTFRDRSGRTVVRSRRDRRQG